MVLDISGRHPQGRGLHDCMEAGLRWEPKPRACRDIFTARLKCRVSLPMISLVSVGASLHLRVFNRAG